MRYDIFDFLDEKLPFRTIRSAFGFARTATAPRKMDECDIEIKNKRREGTEYKGE